MNKRIISLIIAFSTVFQYGTAFAEGTDADTEVLQRTLRFDTSDVIREQIPKELFGYNYEYANAESMAGGTSVRARGADFLATEDQRPNMKAVEQLKGYPFPHARFGGGSFDYVRWKEELGSDAHHKITQSSRNVYTGFSRGIEGTGFYENPSGSNGNLVKNPTSVVDMYKMWEPYDPDFSVTYVLNLNTDTLQNQIDFVEFMTSDGTVNYNGGENWGKIRRENYGIEKTNMYAWELGNEVDLNKMSIDEYIEAIKKFVPAIRTVDKTTPIAVHIASNDTSATGDDWHRRLLLECGDIIDYLVVHKYFGFNGVTAVAENTVRRVINDIERFGDPSRHKILFTEYNTAWITDRRDWNKNTSISSAVTVGDYIIRMMYYPQVIEADFHCLNTSGGDQERIFVNGTWKTSLFYPSDGGPWWAFYVDTDKKVKPTAPVDVLKLFYDNIDGAKVIGCDYEDFELGKGAQSTALALQQKNGDICLFITNFDMERDLKINLENTGYYLKEDTVIYGTNGQYSMNFKDKNEVMVDKHTHKDTSECSSYTVPEMSFAMIRLSPAD